MDPLMATVMIWAPNFAPRQWSLCQGQLLPISSNSALFSLLGTMYGGDGRTSFGLPDLRGRTAIGAGRFPGGAVSYRQGQVGGAEFVTLSTSEIPAHNHTASFTGGPVAGSISIPATTGDGSTASPSASVHLAKGVAQVGFNSGDAKIYSNATVNTTVGGPVAFSGVATGTVAVGFTGGGQAHENRHPFQVLQYIIALQGIFPSRN